jgi:hypothetical protein
MTSGWKHGINLGCAIVGYCIGWYRREDPFVKRDATLHNLLRDQPVAASLTVYGAPITRASGSNACISTDMRDTLDGWEGCKD